MAISRFGDKYTGKLVSENETHWTVDLAAKPNSDAPYPKVQLIIEKKNTLPTELNYFDDQGKKLKTESRSEYRCEKGVCSPGVMKMLDHTSNGHWTKLVRKTWKLNSGISDRVFSKRHLQRGR